MYRRPLLQRLDPPSVAVFRARHLGDMLCAVPALRALRMTLPEARIALVGLPAAREFAARFACYIDEFIPFPGHPLLPEQPVQHDAVAAFYTNLCTRQFALALQLHGGAEVGNEIVSGFGARVMAGFCSGRGVTHARTVLYPYPDTGTEPERLLRLMEHLGAVPGGTHLAFPLSPADDAALERCGADAALAPDTLAPGTYFCIAPGARTRERCWPPAHFADVGDRLAAEFGLQPVLAGASGEGDMARDLATDVGARMAHRPVDLAGRLTTGALAALLRDARLLLCNDTDVSHIAAGLKTHSVVVFSRPDIARWAPQDRHRHRCIWDPDGGRRQVVLRHARALLDGTAPSRQRCVGMWPYW